MTTSLMFPGMVNRIVKTSVGLVSTFETYQAGPSIGSKTVFWLVCVRYIPGSETGVRLVHIWYYLKSLPDWSWYKAGIASGHTSLLESLIPVLITGAGLYT
jgi:hypothetical protein